MNLLNSTSTERGTYQGVFQIVAFNWTMYAAALVTLLLAGILASRVPMGEWIKFVVLLGSGCALFWVLTSICVSHYVYDRSKLYRWNWLEDQFPSPPKQAVNIHAGLDESSEGLKRMFPEMQLVVWDIHDPERMTEPSITRARHSSKERQGPGRKVDFAALPAGNASFAAVFLIFAAHEIRSPDQREALFRELHRVIESTGELLVVEHLRDWKNFIAFGPGFLHFLPRREWLRLSRAAGFQMISEFGITPFVRVFHLQKPV